MHIWTERTFPLMLLLLTGVPLRADPSPTPQAVIDRAIQALGGEANLSRYQATSFKVKGIGHFRELDHPAPYTREVTFQWPDQFRLKMKTEFGGFMVLLNHDKALMEFAQVLITLPKPRTSEIREDVYTLWVATLLPLKDVQRFTLTSVGEEKVKGRPAVGVKIASKGHRDVKLFFDKESGLPVKQESHFKETIRGARNDLSGTFEGTQEVFFKDYLDADGVKLPKKVEVKRDGKPFVEEEFFDWKGFAKLDDKVFTEP